MKTARNFYLAPQVIVFTVEMEQGIVSSSTTLNPGGNGTTNYNPDVNDWTLDDPLDPATGEF
ncbi:hypothetical protein PQ465_18825 [Sphingobacterium oryzagri]|uniref:Uncharacterized protein n=1 Tax=Sphingobacterium oryzagri TaxID=3025669 RepID=A0ABY7WGN3_9SPHI|nr:hypothetical protein [Sphingobacterium sp. KACC 22765]WDF68333.1 hypothetical protein PQ465_18825 [Sphingobacterium sp. KACC 22765]